MRSFELSIDTWKSIENELRTQLHEIDSLRSRFPVVEAKLRTAAKRLHQFGFCTTDGACRASDETEDPVIPQTESLAFDKRHGHAASASEYSAMTQRIERDYESMTLSCELLKEMHRHAVGANTEGAGEWKARRNLFPMFDSEGTWMAARITTPIEELPAYMNQLHDSLNAAISSDEVNPLLWIAAYALDIFAIHPFQDGNGRTTRLAMLLLLYQSGFFFAKYISLEGLVGCRRSAYTDTIIRSYDKWSAASHDPTPWCRFVVDLVLDAYKEFSERTDALSTLADQTAAITDAIAEMPGSFQTANLKLRLPEVPNTIATIVLHRMKERGNIRLSLSGKDVQWVKC